MKKSIRIFYLIYTIYMFVFCSFTNVLLIDIFIPLLLMWGLYLVFSLGYGRELLDLNILKERLNPKRVHDGLVNNYLVGILSIIGWMICSYFYTGLGPINLFKLLLAGESTYQHYQEHFANSNIRDNVLLRLPFIMIMGANRFLFYYSFLKATITGWIKKRRTVIYLFLLIIGHLYFGVSRGTNFEMYQLITVIFFCYILYNEIYKIKPNYFLLGILGCVMVIFFLIMLGNRGHSIELVLDINNSISLDKNSLLVQMAPIIVIVAEWTFGYIGYGLFYLSVMLLDVSLHSIEGFLDIFIPLFYSPLNEASVQADRGVKWVPDMASAIDTVGVLLLFIIVFFIGRVLKMIGNTLKYNVIYFMLAYLMFIQMVSFPIGNFLQYSSEKIVVLISLVYIVIARGFSIKLKFS